MVTFSTATRFEEVPIEVKGIPRILAFGPDYQFSNTTKMRNVAADVANSMQFYQLLFDDKLAGDTMYVTSIAGSHGQAFDGFLHLSEFTFAEEHPGASELFRAHEVAHQWWGHKIGWASYRDQWISDWWASDWRYLSTYYQTGQLPDWHSCRSTGHPRLQPLAIPAFTPNRYPPRYAF